MLAAVVGLAPAPLEASPRLGQSLATTLTSRARNTQRSAGAAKKEPLMSLGPPVWTGRALQVGALSPADRGDGLAHEPLELDAPRTGPGADGDGVQNSRSQHGQNRWVVLA